MKKIIAMILIFVFGIMLTACNNSKTTSSDGVTVKQTGVNTAEITADGQDGKVEVNTMNEGDWCPVGTTSKTTTSDGTATLIIKEKISSGKYAGYCHMVQEADTAVGGMTADYYYKKDGKGYMVMDVAGQHIEREWTNPNI